MPKPFMDSPARGYILLTNGQIKENTQKKPYKADILLKDGVIEKIGAFDSPPGEAKVIEIAGCYVVPGLLDLHVHLREPGNEEKETIATGCAAAAAGGFTAVCCMPNTNPKIDNQEVVRFIKERAHDKLVSVYPIGAVSKECKSEELAEIGFMVKAGIIGITDDGFPIGNSGMVRRALEYSKLFAIPVIEHAQDTSLTWGASMNEGYYSTVLGLHGMPTVAEDIVVSRDIQLLEYIGGQLHIQHISSARSIDMVRRAKDKGLKVTTEATPHHFSLTDREIESYDSNFKMNPPLRSAGDVAAVIEGLRDGTIDAVASDHAPHIKDDKEGEFDRAAFGVTGLETAVGVFFTELVDKHDFDEMDSLLDLFVVNPRKIMHLPVPEIREGTAADFSIINTSLRWTVKEENFYSKAANSCFLGRELRGIVKGVAGKGRIWIREE